MSVLALKLLLFLLNVAGHIRTRRGPDVARGPDVVHHCCIRYIAVVGYSNNQSTIYRTCLSTVCFRTLESLFDVSLYTTCSKNYFCSSCFTIGLHQGCATLGTVIDTS